jgi:UDP-N-acetyl-D-mannosaminuronic acid dehydrogenase
MLDATIIGAGRVGLPLALSLEESGLNIGIKDIDTNILKSLQDGVMPFHEPGYDELIKNTNIEASSTNIPKAKAYIITVGTPLKQHIETDLTAVSIIILRSTVAPNTTEYLINYIDIETGLKHTKDYVIAMCPERIAEGLAKKELTELTQLIGVYNEYSYKKVKEVFHPLIGDNTIQTTPIEAELAKLFCNIYRYINFAIPNYFMYLAGEFNVEPFRLLDAMSINYPRVKNLAKPGFTGGACLRKDFGMINEHFPQTDLLLQAYKINEFLPKLCVDKVGHFVRNNKVGVLGYTFKKDTDDTRDTLAIKLISYIKRETPKEILINDSRLNLGNYNDIMNNNKFNNIEMNEVIQKSDIIFIATNHSEYYKINITEFVGKIVVDPWRVLGGSLVNDYRYVSDKTKEEDMNSNLIEVK